jgi:hypothetical protein
MIKKKCDRFDRWDLQDHFNVVMKPCPVFLANISFPYDSAPIAGLERVIFFPPRIPGEVSPRFDRYSGVFRVL